jgi:urease accessory protein
MNQERSKACFGGDLLRRSPRLQNPFRADSTCGPWRIIIAVYPKWLFVVCKRGEPASPDESNNWWKPLTHTYPTSHLVDETSSPAQHARYAGRLSDHDLQRAAGSCRIVAGGSERGTHLIDIFQQNPIRVLFPRGNGYAIGEAVLINTAGGIAGGDRLQYEVTAHAGASLAVTSQAAEKVYRALDVPAGITTKLEAYAGAKLAWLPQETIIFNRSLLRRETEIALFSGAELLVLESLVLGRTAHGEEIVGGNISDSWRIRKDGRLVWAETFRLTNEVFPQLHRKALLAGCRSIGTLVYFGQNLDARLEVVRKIATSAECRIAATSVGGLIIIRLAAETSFDLRSTLRSFLECFGSALGSGPIRVPKMWSC